jgi:hypothetical protein
MSNLRHGDANHRKRAPEYRAWTQMRSRCSDASRVDYKDYGGRGISVCSRWDSYELFLADLGRRPSPLHSLDRKDNDGDYTPSNCWWATRAAQSRNKRNVVRLTFLGVSMCVTDWARYLGLPKSTLHNRLHNGWSVEQALSTPNSRQERRSDGRYGRKHPTSGATGE